MLETYIKNRGTTKTIIHDNKHKHNLINEINWDADYDGEKAKVDISLKENGHKKHLNFSLDNHDLAKILNIPSVELPLEKRLKKDFYESHNEPLIYRIELEKEPMMLPTHHDTRSSSSIIEMLESVKPNNDTLYLPSPSSNEELLIPLTINENSSGNFTLTPRRRHRRYKTHKTYRVYRRHKKTPKSSRGRSSRRSTRRSSR
jgi:hypothetical protein